MHPRPRTPSPYNPTNRNRTPEPRKKKPRLGLALLAPSQIRENARSGASKVPLPPGAREVGKAAQTAVRGVERGARELNKAEVKILRGAGRIGKDLLTQGPARRAFKGILNELSRPASKSKSSMELGTFAERYRKPEAKKSRVASKKNKPLGGRKLMERPLNLGQRSRY